MHFVATLDSCINTMPLQRTQEDQPSTHFTFRRTGQLATVQLMIGCANPCAATAMCVYSLPECKCNHVAYW